jgi:hypothetical protein
MFKIGSSAVPFAQLAFGLAATGCGSDAAVDSSPAPTAPAGFGAAWAEFLSPAEAQAALPDLAHREVALNLAWPRDQFDDPVRLALAKKAAARGVSLRPWLLLAEADGYWPGASNAEVFSEAARKLMTAWEGAGLAPTVLVVDMEMRFDRSNEMNDLLTAETPDLIGLVTFLREGVDRATYTAATKQYSALVDEAHQRGWQVHLTTLPQVLDDFADDDDDLRQAFGIPLAGVAWDVVSFQAYRTLFGDLLASPGAAKPTAFFVYDYARDAVDRFGPRAGLDIGMVGAGVTPSGIYQGPAELHQDVEAARAAGIPTPQLAVYNLDGMLSRAPAAAWFESTTPNAVPPAADATTEQLRANVNLLDRALDGS